MKYLSVCSGIEAATVAWDSLGWKPVAFSEIEPFPSAVLAHHYPTVPNLGDMTKYKEWNLEAIDILVGGTPCQSFSVAGLRKGLEDPRGNLALTYIGMLDRLRPKWCVWENVPGVLSSNGGRDFGSFLGALAELGYGFAYRVLDAQYFGTPQRRRRVFVVGCLGDMRSAAKVLFESESLRRDSEAGGEKKKRITNPIASSIGDGRIAGNVDITTARMVAFGEYSEDGTASAMKARDYKDATDLIAYSVREDAKANTFSATEITVSNALQSHQPSVQSHHAQTFVAEVAPTIGASGPPYSRTGNSRVESDALAVHGRSVRRLTPTECERLQGFPDGYTNILYKGKSAPDGARYKALGNSMATPVMKWIGERINMVEALG